MPLILCLWSFSIPCLQKLVTLPYSEYRAIISVWNSQSYNQPMPILVCQWEVQINCIAMKEQQTIDQLDDLHMQQIQTAAKKQS
uniref:Aminotransferase-like plant mobile domain-containing protein n=1 Tax=Salix viminalis TaxID=40686 RepID=A0A6N2KLE5_SALVM